MDESISRAGTESQTQRTDTRGELRAAVTYMHGHAQSRQLMGAAAGHRELRLCAAITEGWGQGGKEVEREGTCARLQLVHIAVQQTRHCKAILLQLKINFKRKYIKK